MKRLHMLLVTAAALCIAPPAMAEIQSTDARGWVGLAGTVEAEPVILQFRREFEIASRPKALPLWITADNRFILYVNGTRVASGPSTGDVAHWREEKVDISRYLRRGKNVIAVVIWDEVVPLNIPPNATTQQIQRAQGTALMSEMAPYFQQSVAAGFRVAGEGDAAYLSTDHSGWRVKKLIGHSFTNGYRQLKGWYYVAGHPEIVEGAAADMSWVGPVETGEGWQDAVPVPAAAARTLVKDKLPEQSYVPTHVGRVVRSDIVGAEAFPGRPLTIPKNTKASILLQRDVMVSAYPHLDVVGGKGASIKVTWAEALYDAKRKKGDRNLIGDLKPIGIFDTFKPDGPARQFSTLWWRTWRYVQVEVETKNEPLVLKGFGANQTGYPFEQVGSFSSDDPDLKRIFDIGWRTAKLDAHETYMDTAYWEQLQYAGDTRLQMLISYAVSGDPRLAEQAIDAFAGSDVEQGLMAGAYPTRSDNVIATFALKWVAMLDDWHMHQPDPDPIVRNLPRMRKVLDRFASWQQPSGLLGKNAYWNFIDWAGQSAIDRDRFPSYGTTNESCLLSLDFLGALQQAARLELAYGEKERSEAYSEKALALKSAIREKCWIPSRGLYADNPSGDVFSQHTNALAILYDVATREEAPQILDRISVPGKGIDAPDGMLTVSYYYAWYLAQAYVHAGQADRYVDLLATWRDLLRLNYTTWPEERDTKAASTRSDSHAWSAHPTSDLLGIVAGIGPGSPGYSSVRVAPALGTLTQVDATAATPKGPVSVSYRVKKNKLKVIVTRPEDLPGDFVWKGKVYPLKARVTRLTLDVS